MTDTRNVQDEFKFIDHNEIVNRLDERGVGLEIAIENISRDFSMGSIVRSANAFGARHIHIIGSRQWNKRGAMKTDAYMHLHYYSSVAEFMKNMSNKEVIAFDNNIEGTVELAHATLPKSAVLVFGAEGPGLSHELLSVANYTVAIEQFGSTRSVNVGVAAGIAMYAWLQQNVLDRK